MQHPVIGCSFFLTNQVPPEKKKMPILYALVCRGKCVLAEYTSTSGNFPTVTRVLLSKIPPEDGKMSYTYDKYIFHYITDDTITYLCMADAEAKRRIPFAFLDDIRGRFQAAYGDRGRTAIAFAMNEEFSVDIKNRMEYFNTNPDASSIERVKLQIDGVKSVMVESIEKVLERGEKIELLVDKTDRLNEQAFRFERQATTLKSTMWWKKLKTYGCIAVVASLIIFFIVAVACGGMAFPDC